MFNDSVGGGGAVVMKLFSTRFYRFDKNISYTEVHPNIITIIRLSFLFLNK
jgi:hypothetical protein